MTFRTSSLTTSVGKCKKKGELFLSTGGTRRAYGEGSAPLDEENVMLPAEMESAFLDAIADDPDDDAPRLIFADWLTEKGDARGEFIQVQVELARLSLRDPRSGELKRRERELLRRHGITWRSFPSDRVQVHFERGLTAAVASGWGSSEQRWAKRRGVWLERIRLELNKAADASVRSAAATAAPGRVTTLEIIGQYVTHLGLAHLEGLSRLRKLVLWNVAAPAALFSFLSGMSRLRHLEIVDVDLGETDLTPLASLPELHSLILGQARLTPHHLTPLAEMTALRSLVLSRNDITDEGLTPLASLTLVELLDLFHGRITDEGVPALARLSHLKCLQLGRTAVSDAGLETLSALTQLEELGLKGTKVMGTGLRHLSALPRL